MENLSHQFQDPAFWVYCAFFAFLILSVWKGRVAVKTMLDGKIAEIIREIENAQILREEALGVLAEAKYKEQFAETRIRDMQQETEDRIRTVEDNAKKALGRHLELQRKKMEEKITRMEKEAQRRIKQAITDSALDIAGKILREEFGELEDKNYTALMIEKLPAQYAENQQQTR